MIIAHYQGLRLEENRICPHCDGKLHKHGLRKRSLIGPDGKTGHLLPRYCCRACGKSLTVLAPDMLPYKHHAASVIEATLVNDGTSIDSDVDEKTLYRWRNEFQARLAYAYYHLLRLVFHLNLPQPPVLHELAQYQAFLVLLDLFLKSLPSFDSTLEYVFWLSYPLRLS